MRKQLFTVAILCTLFSCQQAQDSGAIEEKKSAKIESKSAFFDAKVESKIDKLISEMTIEEKVGQMTQITLDVISKGANYDANKEQEIDDSLLYNAIVKYGVGSVLNTGQYTLPREKWQLFIGKIQEASQKTALQIPVLYGVDAIHGVNYTVGGTLFPQELATAATFQPEYARLCGEVTAYELRASSIPWNFSPVLDLGRQPLWSRFFETFGEDPYMVTQMGKAIVAGYQGTATSEKQIDNNHVAACLKHFVGYSNAKTGKDRTPIQMSERELREYYLTPFKAAIENGAQSVMINSTEINGTPVHADHHILTDILKDELKFEGFAVTDWEDILYLHNTHRIAKDEKEATKIAINAGIDMSMVPMKLDFADHLVALVKEGEVSEERINDAVRRILRVKFRVGLFETPVTPMENYPKFGSEEFSNHAYEAAKESITLLKNEKNLLPLNTSSKVLITGVGAHSLNALNGAWTHTWQGVNDQFNTKGKKTIVEAAKELAVNVSYVQGTDYQEAIDIQKAVAEAKKNDVIVVVLGETPATEKVGDIVDLNLPEAQKELVRQLAKTKKPIVAVLLQSRPRVISDIEPLLSAVVEAYWPGDEGGRAIAETLFGLNNPSGRLPFTYPRYANDLVTYDHKYSETKDKDFGNNAFNPQWEFGFGLSYTTFEYSNLTLSDSLFSDSFEVTVTVKNVGDREGKESILLFTEDKVASITPSVKRLRKFQKINLEPGEEKSVSFTVTAEDLAFMNNEFKWITEPGDFKVMVGDLSSDIVYKK